MHLHLLPRNKQIFRSQCTFLVMNSLKRHSSIYFIKKNTVGINFLNSVSAVSTKSPEKSTEVENLNNRKLGPPPLLHRTLEFCPKYLTPRQVWIENLDEVKEKKKGLIDLHPKIFGTIPRLDLIHENIKWQNLYKTVVVFSAKVTGELPGRHRKPWPQKGLGKARQGSIRAPQFTKGGTCHGPRNPTTYFYMLPWEIRLHGLTSTLSAKFAQDDLHVIDNLNIPTDDSQFILDLIKERNWGPSVLLVDDNDIMPRNITVATDPIGHVNLMPVYGLNVFGMLKHDTLVLTLTAVEKIEKKLVTLLNTANALELTKQFSKYCR